LGHWRTRSLAGGLASLYAPWMDETKPNALTHLDEQGRARMVDVGPKEITSRVARAQSVVRMSPSTLSLLVSGSAPKGDVLAVARVAGIQAAKKTPELIPLCHTVALTSVEVVLEPSGEATLEILATARCLDRTGVEMEALVAASVAALTVYDMLKAVDRSMTIEATRLLEKSGGRSGHFRASS